MLIASRFRWAQCQLDTLEFCSSSEEIDQVLESLPKGLPATYEQILARIDERQRKNVWLVLVSLSFATCPLTIDQVANLLRIDPCHKPRTKPITIYHHRLLAACSSLVSTFSIVEDYEDDEDDEGFGVGSSKLHLRLAHLSVKEYLVSEGIKRSSVSGFWMSHGLGNRVLAELCISCLLQHDNIASFGRQTLDAFPFTTYAVENWAGHAKEANGEETGRKLLDHLIFELLHDPVPDVYLNCFRVSRRDFDFRTAVGLGFKGQLDWAEPNVLPSVIHRPEIQAEIRDLAIRVKRPSIALATEYNLWRAVKALLQAQQPGNDEMDEAMLMGLRGRANESLEVLVVLGKADVNSRRAHRHLSETAPLTLLERCRTLCSIRWLRAHGASMHPDPRFRHPLHRFCSCFGNVLWTCPTTRMTPPAEILACLLELEDNLLWTRPLTPMTPPAEIVAFLLESGAYPDTAFEHRYDTRPWVWLSTPLQQAAYRGDLDLVGILLDHGATLNLVQGRVGSCLHAAAIGGHHVTFCHLLAEGADIHAISERYGSVLWAAGHGGSPDIVKTCLEQGLCWKEFIDTKLESEWRTLDFESQENLTARIIQVSKERHSSLAEAMDSGMVSLDEGIRLARSFGLGDDVLDGLARIKEIEADLGFGLTPLQGKHLALLWDYPFQGPLSHAWRVSSGRLLEETTN